MALIDQVNALVPAQTLLEMSRYRTPGSSSTDTTWTAAVATSAEGEFYTRTGLEYDSTDTRHHRAGVALFLAAAYEYRSDKTALQEKHASAAEDLCREIRGQIGLGKRATCKSSSQLTPSDEIVAGETKRPAFDADTFAARTLNPPRR